MPLNRSTAGLAAEHLLHGVDVVVWTEGGAIPKFSATNQEDQTNQLPSVAPYGDDVQFWRAIFHRFIPNLRARFKPAGSKSRIKEIAAEVQSNRLANIVVCLDRDHDDLIGGLVSDDNVIYTRWYSWENECWTAENVLSAFEQIYSGTELPSDVRPLLEQQKRHAIRKLTWHVRADVLRSIGRMPRYLSRETNRISGHDGSSTPILRTSFLISNCRQNARSRFRMLPGTKISVHAHCIGHILSNFYFHTLRVLVKRHLNETLSKLTAKTIVVGGFQSRLGGDRAARTYYKPLLVGMRMNHPLTARPRRRRVKTI